MIRFEDLVEHVLQLVDIFLRVGRDAVHPLGDVGTEFVRLGPQLVVREPLHIGFERVHSHDTRLLLFECALVFVTDKKLAYAFAEFLKFHMSLYLPRDGT